MGGSFQLHDTAAVPPRKKIQLSTG